jgi:YegS/Rv2252/BmrU family lipid kinase
MLKKRILFILNPISGTVKKAGIPQLVENYLDHSLFDPVFRYTEYAGHATEIAQEACEDGYDIVVAVGGDGTINEVGRALIHTSTAMGILPCGSGNGLARHLKIPMNMKKALSIINQCDIRELDYGTINNNPFFCTCGMGFDAFISQKFAEGGKRGKLKYMQLVLSQGLRYKGEPYDITIGNEELHHFAYLVSCANASQYGNNAYIAPQASMSDGLLDIIVMDPFGFLDAPEMSFDMMNKTLDRSSKVQTFRTDHIHVHRQEEGPVHYDGDPVMMGKDIDVKIVKRGIRIVVNPDAKTLKPNKLQNVICDLFNDFSDLRGKMKRTKD